MYKSLIILIVLLKAGMLLASEKYTFQKADSLTYQLFLHQQWDQLTKTGKEIHKQGIDFKWLDQRIGYAYYMQKNYFASRKYYEKALSFDKSDQISIEYLYFNGLYLDDPGYARYYAGQLSDTLKHIFKIKKWRIVDAVDAEYNYKTAYALTGTELRSAPSYFRVGLNSQLGYHLNFYQSFSDFQQTNYGTYVTKQPEYFGLINYAPLPSMNLLLGYHYVYTKIDSTKYPGNMFLGKLIWKRGRFDIGAGASYFRSALGNSFQADFEAGFSLPVHPPIYLKSKVSYLNDSISARWVYSETASILLFHRVWAEANVTFGNLNDYVDMNGMYIFNSIDPTVFRRGLSLFWYVNPHLTAYVNYTLDNKNITYYNIDYQQHSMTGGLIWKF